MVEITDQIARRSLICWRGRRELITDVRKTRNHGYDVIVGGELFTDYPITLANPASHAKPKLKSTGAGRYHFFPLADAYRKQFT